MPAQQLSSKSEFDSAINENSDSIVVIEFMSASCGTCNMVAPTVNALADKKSDKLRIFKIDADELEDVAKSCNIEQTPTFIIYKNKKEASRFSNSDPQNLEKRLDAACE